MRQPPAARDAEIKALKAELAQAREQAETLALRVSFKNFHAKARDDPRIGLLGAIHMLPKATRLKDRAFADSLNLHLPAWRAECMFKDMIFQHQGVLITVAFSPDGKSLLTGSWDKTARLWESATGKPLGAPLQHQGQVVAVAFSPDGKSVLTGSHDKTARLWKTPQPIRGDPERLRLWAEVGTGCELADDFGTLRVLDPAEWQHRRAQLEKLGGAPVME